MKKVGLVLGGAAASLLVLAACGEDRKAKTAANEDTPAGAAIPAATPAAGGTAEASPNAPLKEIASPGAAKDHATAYRQDMTEIAVAAKGDAAGGDKLEHMIRIKAGDHINYTWEVLEGGDFWHEFHGHTADAVTFYKKAGGAAHQGSLVAPFDGEHGWYFENRADKPVILRIRTSGFYERVVAEAE